MGQPVKTIQAEALAWIDLRKAPQWLSLIAGWHQEEWPDNSLEQRLSRLQKHMGPEPTPVTFVLQYQSQPVATVSLVQYQRLGGYPASYWVANVYVIPSFRRQGLGAVLLQKVTAFAHQQAIPQLFLYTHDRKDFYLSQGWLVVSEKPDGDTVGTIMSFNLP